MIGAPDENGLIKPKGSACFGIRAGGASADERELIEFIKQRLRRSNIRAG